MVEDPLGASDGQILPGSAVNRLPHLRNPADRRFAGGRGGGADTNSWRAPRGVEFSKQGALSSLRGTARAWQSGIGAAVFSSAWRPVQQEMSGRPILPDFVAVVSSVWARQCQLCCGGRPPQRALALANHAVKCYFR
jgi:hypothetical protein